jgi:NAD(P)-dependent dehydrogenase (short-subunit alcohol dehydrogenase family)
MSRIFMKEEFKGKVALVTGATSGMGRATAIAFGAAGANVVLAARREKEGVTLVDEIQKNGSEAIFVATDVTKEADVAALMKAADEKFGRLDFAFNNAGSAVGPKSLTEMTEEDWDADISVNLKSSWLSMKYEMPLMARSGGGGIVNMSSIGALLGLANFGAYNAAKGGAISLTRTAAAEGAAQNIRVNSIAPGATKTELLKGFPAEVLEHLRLSIPLKKIGEPEDIAHLVLFLCSPAAGFITGQNISIDGGSTAIQRDIM